MKDNKGKSVLLSAFALSFVLASQNGLAAADDLADATVISALPFSEQINNSTFDIETNEIVDSLGVSDGSFWYSFTPASNTNLVIILNGEDTEIGVYTGNSHPLTPVNNVNSASDNPIDNDDYEDDSANSSDDSEFLVVPLTGGTTYKIQGASNSDVDRGINGIQMFADSSLSGADDLANATVVNSFPFIDAVDNAGFGFETNEVLCDDDFRSFWYEVTPSESGTLLVDAWGSDTEIAIFTGGGHPMSETSGCTNTDLDNRAGSSEHVEILVNKGTTYYIQIGDNDDPAEYSAHLTEIDFIGPQAVPALSFWGLGILAGLLGFVGIRRKMK